MIFVPAPFGVKTWEEAMKNLWKIAIAVVLLIAVLLVQKSLRRQAVSPPGGKIEKQTLRVVIPPWWEINLVGEPGVFSTEIAPEFRRRHPDVKLIIDTITGDTEGRTKYLLQCRQGTMPDVITLDGFWIAEFASLGCTVPLDDFMPDSLKEDYYEPFLIRYKGRIHGIVGETAFNAMLWYRKDLFEKAGLTHPPRDWEELRAYARKLTQRDESGEVVCYGLALPGARSEHTSVVLLGFYWEGEDVFVTPDNEPAYNNQTSVDLFNLFAAMYQEGSLPPETVNMLYEDVDKLFASGKAAMMLHGSWLTVSIEKKAPQLKGKIGLAPLPVYPRTGRRAVNAGGWGISITTHDTSKHQLAWDFIQMVVVDPTFHLKRIKELGSIPVRKSLEGDPYFSQTEWGRTILAQLPLAKTRPSVEIYPDASLAWVRAFQEVLLGKKTAEQALQDAEQWTRQIAREKGYLSSATLIR